jgi:hypothetical protein
VQYIDEDGKAAYMTKVVGDSPLSTCLGLLELAKQHIYHEEFIAEEE